jgi:3-oxoacyl-[acyl-carrier-protein] synthase-3
MQYSKVYLEAFGYEIAPVVVSSAELEARLEPVYEALHFRPGQLEALTGIIERRWWEEGYRLSEGAALAARRAMELADIGPDQVGAVIYGGVCREYFEPATACRIAASLRIGSDAIVYDISNACLGVLNGIIEIANRIELGQIRAGLVVASETAREINDIMIERMCQDRSMDFFKRSLATLTGGSGAVAVLLSDGSFGREHRRRLVGGVTQAAPQFHSLCRWGIEASKPLSAHHFLQFTSTDSAAVLTHGVELGIRTWHAFLRKLGWVKGQIDKVICHQVGAAHRETMLQSLGIAFHKDYSTFPYLGNIGTVSLPLTAALAEDRDVLRPGDRVAFLGIGSGLNCLMLGLDW